MRFRLSVLPTVLLLAILLGNLAGCAAGPERIIATFKGYERAGISPGTPSTLQEQAAAPLTGNAYVTLPDSSVVLASCPLQGLQSAEQVLVQQNPDGAYVVVGRPD